MKKGLVLLAGIFLLTGCGSKDEAVNKVTCKLTDSNSEDKMVEVITASFDSNNKLTKTEVAIEFEDEETQKFYCNIYNTMNVGKSDDEKVKITCDGKKVVIDDYLKFVGKSEDKTGESKDEFIEEFTKDGFECK